MVINKPTESDCNSPISNNDHTHDKIADKYIRTPIIPLTHGGNFISKSTQSVRINVNNTDSNNEINGNDGHILCVPDHLRNKDRSVSMHELKR